MKQSTPPAPTATTDHVAKSDGGLTREEKAFLDYLAEMLAKEALAEAERAAQATREYPPQKVVQVRTPNGTEGS